MAGMRLQIRHWRAVTWVATVGVAGGAGTMLWTIVKNFREGHYKSRTSSDFNAIIEKAAGTIQRDTIGITPKASFAALWNSPYNGYVRVVQPVADSTPPKPPEPAKKPIGDVLSVKVVTYAPDDGGRVVVEYKDDRAKQDAHTDQIILRVGAKLAQPYDAEPY